MEKYRAAIVSLGSKSSKMTADAMRKYFEVDELQIKDFDITLGSGDPVLYQGKELPDYDCMYVKGSFRYSAVAHALTAHCYKKTYMPIKAESFNIAHDKLLTHILLEEHGIPMPRTYLSATPQAAKEVLKTITYPIIMKFPQGTHGKGVMFADTFSSASSVLDALDSLRQSFLIQEYMETGGEDIRAFVVGGRVVAAMKRKASGEEKRSNVHAGGTAQSFVLDAQSKKVALASAKALGAEICGVDILEGVKGPRVIEANVSPGLQGITDATGIDVAGAIAKHLYEKTAEFKSENVPAQDIIDDETQIQVNSVFGPLDFRGERIVLPVMVARQAGIGETDDCTMTFSKGHIEIKKGI